MALTPTIVEQFLAAEKSVLASERMTWRRRNEAIVVCRIGVAAGGATVGELVLLVSLVVRRGWTFKLLRRSEEVIRWDLAPPPVRHSNPPGRPPEFPGKVRALAHVGGDLGDELCASPGAFVVNRERSPSGVGRVPRPCEHHFRRDLPAAATARRTAPARVTPMTLHAENIRSDLLTVLDEDLDVVVRGDQLAVLTPADYPDGDGVVVNISAATNGYVLSDAGEGDARLVAGGPGPRAVGPAAYAICARHGATFDAGRVVARVDHASEIAQACWRVAQASVAIAEAATYHRPPRARERELADLVASSVASLRLSVEREREVLGASGHSYAASLYVPERETVIEPVGAEKAWNVASAVYVQFGDLRDVNGYQLIAVMDDREQVPGDEVERLLRQVGVVARFSEADQWLSGLARDELV